MASSPPLSNTVESIVPSNSGMKKENQQEPERQKECKEDRTNETANIEGNSLQTTTNRDEHSNSNAKKKKKQRWSREQKRENKKIKLQEAEEDIIDADVGQHVDQLLLSSDEIQILDCAKSKPIQSTKSVRIIYHNKNVGVSSSSLSQQVTMRRKRRVHVITSCVLPPRSTFTAAPSETKCLKAESLVATADASKGKSLEAAAAMMGESYVGHENDVAPSRGEGATSTSRSAAAAVAIEPITQPLLSITIHIQPLLILDVNGILCHRNRLTQKKMNEQNLEFRQAAGSGSSKIRKNLGGTTIIPRTNLHEFVTYLDKHFTLAIWTSATQRVIKKFLPMLLPQHVIQKLLFLWTQEQCCILDDVVDVGLKNQTEATDEVDNSCGINARDVIYGKQLSRVWDHPTFGRLFNKSNTLLIDDSSDKCPIDSCSFNTLHPPSIHGMVKGTSDNTTEESSDEYNEIQQQLFFDKLVKFWSSDPVSARSRSAGGGDSDSKQHEQGEEEEEQRAALYEFLKQHGTEHMGWRGSDYDSSVDDKGSTERTGCQASTATVVQ